MLYRYTGATPIPFQFSETRSGMLMPGAEIEIERVLVNASAFDRLRTQRKLVPVRATKKSPVVTQSGVEAKKIARAKKIEPVSVPEINRAEVLVRSVQLANVEESIHSSDVGFIQEAQPMATEPELEAIEIDVEDESEFENDEQSEVGKVGEVQIDDVKREEVQADDSPPAARRSRVKRRIF